MFATNSVVVAMLYCIVAIFNCCASAERNITSDTECTTVFGPQSASNYGATSTVTCDMNYTLVSCGSYSGWPTNAGSRILSGKTCIAVHGANTVDTFVRAVARCCKLDESITCNSYQSVISGSTDDASTIQPCGLAETITGCTAYAATAGIDGSCADLEPLCDLANLNTLETITTQQCKAYNGAQGNGIYAVSQCCSYNNNMGSMENIKLECARITAAKSGTSDDAYSIASCPNDYFMSGCSGYSRYQSLDGWFFHDTLEECRARNKANGLGVYAQAICCKEIKTYSSCEQVGEIKHINWNQLQNAANNSAQIAYSSFIMNLDKNKLEMTFDIDLEYVGSSFDSNSNAYNLGTTYVIDFQSFETSGNKINEPGNCQNRIYGSFENLTFDQWWNYSEYPYLSSNDLSSNRYLSYPPASQYWTLSIHPSTCSPINYFGKFSWNDLSECRDFYGNDLINIVDDNTSITLSGTFYVNLVSPYSMSAIDTGIYRSFPLIQQDFEISILKEINVLSSTGIDLFITSIIGIYEDETDESFELSILTQSADYIELINPIVLTTPLGIASITEVTTSCLVASSYTCGQIFTLRIDDSQISCPPADFSGNYNLQFQVSCPGNEPVCGAFTDDNNGSIIALSVTSNFIDTTCKQELYQVIFDANMQFYDDEEFNTIHDNTNGDNNYVIGKDIIYIKVEANFPDDGSGDNVIIFGVEINNVFVCTADDNIDLTHHLTQQTGNGGCLSSSIDPDGPYNIISNGIVNTDYQTQIISNSGTANIVQFSFLTFDIGRTTMYVHVQLTLILQNGNRRRLQLLQINNDDNSNQMRHFIDSTTIDGVLLTTEYDQKEDNNSHTTSYKYYYLFQFLFIAHIVTN